MSTHDSEKAEEFSLKKLFVPFTALKAIHLLIIVGIFVYANMVFNGFVADDGLQVRQNHLLTSLAYIPHFFLGNLLDYGHSAPFQNLYYKPIMFTMYTLITVIFGKTPFYFHFFQLTLHITNAILVFLLFKNFINKYLSCFLALVFLVHPINQETVAYIANLQDVLFLFFGQAALWVTLQYKYTTKSILVTSLLLFLSLLSKETGIACIIILLLYVHLYKRHYIKRYIAAAASVCSIYLILRLTAVGTTVTNANDFPIMHLSLLERLVNIPKIITYYFFTFLYPKDLAITQNWVVTKIDVVNFYLPLLILIAIVSVFSYLIFTFYRTKSNSKAMFFFGVWFLLGLIIHVQIFPLDQTVADRWFYFPVVGLLGISGLLMDRIKITVYRSSQSRIFILLAVILITTLSIRTVVRNADWKDAITLYTHDLAVNNDNYVLENSLGYELYTDGRLDEAKYHLNKSHSLKSDNVLNLYNLGVVHSLLWQKDKSENNFNLAEQYYKTVITSHKLSWSYEDLTLLYYFNKQFKEAKQVSEKGLNLYPNNAYLWFLLSKTEYELKNKEGARIAGNNAYRLEPTADKEKWMQVIYSK